MVFLIPNFASAHTDHVGRDKNEVQLSGEVLGVAMTTGGERKGHCMWPWFERDWF